MACKVFGNPVTDETARKFYPNESKITAKHRAEAAVQCMSSKEYVKELKSFLDNLRAAVVLSGTSTLSVIYNTTGNDVTLIKKCVCDGTMTGPPNIIHNGQIVAFQHRNPKGECTAAIVYREEYDFLFAWNIDGSPNHVFTKIGEHGDFDAVNCEFIRPLLKTQPNCHSDDIIVRFSEIKLGPGKWPPLVARMTAGGLNTENDVWINSK